MAKQTEHGRLIDTAAKAALAPLGGQRRGRSRVWRFDRGVWGVWIEFQPSGWSKGSYLNVGPEWFWHAGPGLSWTYRPADFIGFENAEQFKPLIESMAAVAAREVHVLTQRFKDLSAICEHLHSLLGGEGWPVYDAAIAYALAGDLDTSRALFQRLSQWQSDYDWQEDLKARSAALAALLADPDEFREAIVRLIQEKRRLIGFPEDLRCLDAATADRGAR